MKYEDSKKIILLKEKYTIEVRAAEIQLKHDREHKSLARFIPLQVERLEVYKRVVKDLEELLNDH